MMSVAISPTYDLAMLADNAASGERAEVAATAAAVVARHANRRNAHRISPLVHNLRAFTVELDNFAQELVSKMETEYLEDE